MKYQLFFPDGTDEYVSATMFRAAIITNPGKITEDNLGTYFYSDHRLIGAIWYDRDEE